MDQPPRFVSRGGEKLAAWLERFPLDLAGAHVLDVGASTGGFTDCALQAGAASATCVDVGHGQLHEKLRRDPRVTNLEKVNARHLAAGDLPRAAYDLLVMDLSFISLKSVLPAVWPFLRPGGTLIALVVEGWPVLGVIDQPVLGERWLGVTGQPTTLNGTPVRTRACAALGEAALATTGPHYFDDHDGEHFMALAARTDHKRMVMGGDCYNYAMLASGFIDVVCEANLKLHDYAALVPVVEGAGGLMADWNGEPLHAGSSGHVLALGDPARLEDVVAALACGH